VLQGGRASRRRPAEERDHPGDGIARPEDEQQKSTVLGRIEIRAGESASFDVKLP
jgi:hypothetical protein